MLDALDRGEAKVLAARRIGPARAFERLWEETGCRAVIEELAGGRMKTLHQLDYKTHADVELASNFVARASPLYSANHAFADSGIPSSLREPLSRSFFCTLRRPDERDPVGGGLAFSSAIPRLIVLRATPVACSTT